MTKFQRRLLAPLLLVLSMALTMSAQAVEQRTDQFSSSTSRIVKGSFKNPESILHDKERDLYLVSNMNGLKHSTKDNSGFISLISPSGIILDEHWIAGGQNNVVLNKPTGMAIVGRTLWIADHDTLRSFDADTGHPLSNIPVPRAKCLNDVVAAKDGSIFVSDCGLDDEFNPTGSDAIWKIAPDGKLIMAYGGDVAIRPNGMSFDDEGNLYWASLTTTGEITSVTPSGIKSTIPVPTGMLDGIALDSEGNIYVSSWGANSVYLIRPSSEPMVVARVGVADLSIDRKRNLLLMPLLYENQLLITSLLNK